MKAFTLLSTYLIYYTNVFGKQNSTRPYPHFKISSYQLTRDNNVRKYQLKRRNINVFEKKKKTFKSLPNHIIFRVVKNYQVKHYPYKVSLLI